VGDTYSHALGTREIERREEKEKKMAGEEDVGNGLKIG